MRTSEIQGRGVIAARSFQKGEVILIIDDTDIVKDTSTLTEEDWKINTDYFDGKTIIMKEPERCINHSCDPNSFIKTINRVRKVIALKDISEDEEVVYDYAINGDNEGTFICQCGKERCRRNYIGNYFKLPVELQMEYLPLLEDWFVRKHKEEIESLKKI
jgi:SET domain-containing protein